MSRFRRNILLTGVFCLVLHPLIAGEKSVKFGIGYKAYELNKNEKLIHSGRYFHVATPINSEINLETKFNFKFQTQTEKSH